MHTKATKKPNVKNRFFERFFTSADRGRRTARAPSININIFQYSVLSAHEQLMSCVRSLQLLNYIEY